MSHPIMFSDDDPVLGRLRQACAAFPATVEFVSHGRPCFKAGEKGKIYAVYGGGEASAGGERSDRRPKRAPGDHHRVDTALLFKADPAEIEAFDADERFFVPAYYGPYGWRAIDLDLPGLDGQEVAELLDASYRAVAGKRLIAELDARAEHAG